jgi:dCMP deaminase
MAILSERWQQYYMRMAECAATGSKDGSSQFGAVLVRPNKRFASAGFNGLPERIPDDFDLLNNAERRPEKYGLIIHAEENCLDNYEGFDTKGFHMFVTAHPCADCAKRLINTGIDYVYWNPDKTNYMTRWADSVANARAKLEQAGIRLVPVSVS